MHAAGFTFDAILAGYDASAAIFRGNKTTKAPFGAAALFIRYLRAERVVCQPIRPPSPAETWPIFGAFRAWMRRHRGLSEMTLDTYQRVIVDLLEALGDNPAAFTAEAVRAFVLQRAKPHGRARATSIAVATRSFLRFLVATAQCPAGRGYALPSFANWQLSSIPRIL